MLTPRLIYLIKEKLVGLIGGLWKEKRFDSDHGVLSQIQFGRHNSER